MNEGRKKGAALDTNFSDDEEYWYVMLPRDNFCYMFLVNLHAPKFFANQCTISTGQGA